ncbi:secreted acidic protein 2-like [Palaemon carinicauda]|uniref:secreted acidic protein 2-like n=1 Tax=Palaemon carinicauda TaxID=392227 RepID=UPI0035B58837
MGMMKTIMGEGAVGGLSSASGNGLIGDENAKVGDNGKGSDSDSSNSDSDIEDKGISEEVGNKKEGSSDDSGENERDMCKTVYERGTSIAVDDDDDDYDDDDNNHDPNQRSSCGKLPSNELLNTEL